MRPRRRTPRRRSGRRSGARTIPPGLFAAGLHDRPHHRRVLRPVRGRQSPLGPRAYASSPDLSGYAPVTSIMPETARARRGLFFTAPASTTPKIGRQPVACRHAATFGITFDPSNLEGVEAIAAVDRRETAMERGRRIEENQTGERPSDARVRRCAGSWASTARTPSPPPSWMPPATASSSDRATDKWRRQNPAKQRGDLHKWRCRSQVGSWVACRGAEIICFPSSPSQSLCPEAYVRVIMRDPDMVAAAVVRELATGSGKDQPGSVVQSSR